MTLLRRLFSAIILLGGSGLILLWLPSIVGVILIMMLCIMSLIEFYHIQKSSGIPAFNRIGIVSGIAILTSAYISLNIDVLIGPSAVEAWREFPALIVTLIVFVTFVRQFPQKENHQPLSTIACTLLGLAYIPFMLMYMMQLGFRWSPTAWNEPFSPTARALIV
jgi:CDP-diglyceride synthetase